MLKEKKNDDDKINSVQKLHQENHETIIKIDSKIN